MSPGRDDPDLRAIDSALAPHLPDGGPLVEATVRDFFAGKALSGYVHLMPVLWTAASTLENARHLATQCYVIADAMLAERERRSEPTP